MLLSYVEILTLIISGIVEGATPEMVNSSSMDITLGETIMWEIDFTSKNALQPDISLKNRNHLKMQELDMTEFGYRLRPGEFILAHSQQIFNLPNNISAEYKLKSSMARIGLEHLNAGWCDAGWHGSKLTLELKNMTNFHNIRLHTGDRIGQVVFFKHEEVPDFASYAARGRYNNDKTVKGAKR